jgi:hypothetical protein
MLGRKIPTRETCSVASLLKTAVQDRLPFMVTDPALQPLPLQPEKMEPPAGIALRATTVPLVYDSEQSPPQLIPAGLLVTVPLPVPVLVTESPKVWTG